MDIVDLRHCVNGRPPLILRVGFPLFLLIAAFSPLFMAGQGRGAAVRPGVSTPGVRRELSAVQPAAIFRIPGMPDWLLLTEDAVWFSNAPRNTLHRVDPRTNQVVATIPVGEKPCSGLASGFGSIWVPNCGSGSLSRVDIATNSVVATILLRPADSEGGLATSPDAVWMLTDAKGILSRIDPKTNRVAAEVSVPPESAACAYGDGAVWVTSPGKSVLARVDAVTNTVTDTIPVGPRPRFLTVGAGSIWTLNQGDGTVSRVDAKTRKLIATIQVGVPGFGGDIAFGRDHIWVTVFQIPLSEIDPAKNQVIRQWFGAGGDSIRVGHGAIWLANLREENVWRIDPQQLDR